MICVEMDGPTARRRGFNAFFAFVRTASSRPADDDNEYPAVSDPRIPFRFAVCYVFLCVFLVLLGFAPVRSLTVQR